MADFTFDQIFAADPSNVANIAANSLVTIFSPGDPTRTPLPLFTVAGASLPNPVQVNSNGFGPPFIVRDLDRVAWEGGGFSGFFTSYEGIKNVAVAAQAAAEEVQRKALAGELGGGSGGGGGGGGAPNNGAYWNRTQTAPVITIGASAPWPTSAPEGAVIIRLTGTGA